MSLKSQGAMSAVRKKTDESESVSNGSRVLVAEVKVVRAKGEATAEATFTKFGKQLHNTSVRAFALRLLKSIQ